MFLMEEIFMPLLTFRKILKGLSIIRQTSWSVGAVSCEKTLIRSILSSTRKTRLLTDVVIFCGLEKPSIQNLRHAMRYSTVTKRLTAHLVVREPLRGWLSGMQKGN